MKVYLRLYLETFEHILKNVHWTSFKSQTLENGVVFILFIIINILIIYYCAVGYDL